MLIYVAIACVVISVVWFFIVRKKANSRPGPWGFPIVGHLPLIGVNPAKVLLRWKKIYGPIVFCRFGSVPTVIINETDWIIEILKLENASGRVKLHFADLLTNRKGIVLNEGADVYEQRQFVMKTLKNFGYGKSGMEERMRFEISHLLCHFQSLADTTKKLELHHCFNVSIINALWDIVMGSKFDRNPDHESDVLRLVGYFKELNNSESLAAKLILFWPVFSKLLNFLGKNWSKQNLQNVYNYMSDKIEERRLTWSPGHPRDLTDAYFDKSAAQSTLETSSFHPKRKVQAITTTDIFFGGVDTVSISLEWLLLYMATNLDIQSKMQVEIDTKIGSRQPSLQDRPELSYCNAVCYELLRISSLIPFGVPHRAMGDFTFHGHKISNDTLIIPNLYGVHLDEDNWSEPTKFRPDRFLHEDGKFKKPEKHYLPFGTGKRICIGEMLGKDELFLYCVCIFQKFSVSLVDPMKKPSFEPIFGFICSPKPCTVVLDRREVSGL